MIRAIVIFFVLISFASGETREKALALAHKAGTIIQEDPTQASQLAEEAFDTLKASPNPAAHDLAACAALAARSARIAGDETRAKEWFNVALPLASPADAIPLRAELADMLMRAGNLPEARAGLGEPPSDSAPPHALAQWNQTLAKLHLACGLPEEAKTAIEAALAALPEEDLANHIALSIDAAGINLRLGLDNSTLLESAREKLRSLSDPHPELVSALTSIAAQQPNLTPDQSLSLLQAVELESLPEGARLTYSITLAEAAARSGKSGLVSEVLEPVLQSDLLPDDHPLLAKALSLAADASGDANHARESADVSLRWLANSEDSQILLGLQRTVDPLTPLVHHAPEELSRVALQAQNFALRKRLDGRPVLSDRQTVLYLVYREQNQDHYGALVHAPEPKWIPLGPAERIHTRISDAIETAERTLAEVETGSRLSVRLTQLWKSLWQPLESSLDPTLPIDIAPVGMLHAVPWSVLRQRDGRCLCQVLTDVRILALTGSFPAQVTSSGLLACGTSSAPGRLDPQGTFPFDHQLASLVGKLPALPGVQKELALFPDQSTNNPSRQQFLELLNKPVGTLHLAGHGFVIESDEGHGFRAGLIFHGGGAGNILFAREIADLELSATGLVVLSACRGGIGQSEIGGNWSSLRRSFIAAGARRVLASQWQVRDDHLPDFMEQFYRERKSHPDHLALWKLQKNLLTTGDELELASVGSWILEVVPSD